MKNVCLIATLDTKAGEARFLRQALEDLGLAVTLVDTGILRPSPPDADISQAQVMAGMEGELRAAKTRGEASAFMEKGLIRVVERLYEQGRLDAALSLGGSGGTALASAAMRRLPLGVPKIIVSTMASGNTLPYVQGEDILLVNPVADIQSLNFLTRTALRRAAAMAAALLDAPMEPPGAKQTVAISGFGVTTPCVDACVARLEQAGYETVVFHARGVSGGRIMEKMIGEGRFAGVLDLTTSEIADEAAGGIYAVGPQRLATAAALNIPYVVTPGALEMINLGTEDTLTPAQRERVLYRHSPSSVKMRANGAEMRACAQLFVQRLSPSRGNAAVLVPLGGFSAVDRPGQAFYDPAADAAFLEALTAEMPPWVPVTALDMHQNDPGFAAACADTLLALMARREREATHD